MPQYRPLDIHPIGFPILDELRLDLLTKRDMNERRVRLEEKKCTAVVAVCKFFTKKLKKVGIEASPQNAEVIDVDKRGVLSIHYFAGYFEALISATFFNATDLVLEVEAFDHIRAEKTGIVLRLGEKYYYPERQ